LFSPAVMIKDPQVQQREVRADCVCSNSAQMPMARQLERSLSRDAAQAAGGGPTICHQGRCYGSQIPVKGKRAMLISLKQLGNPENARRTGIRPLGLRNNSRGAAMRQTAAGQCWEAAGHGPVSITGRTRAGVWLEHQAITTHDSCVDESLSSRQLGMPRPCGQDIDLGKTS